MNNRETLMELMLDHGLERREIAELVLVQRDLVDRWLHRTNRRVRSRFQIWRSSC